MNYLISFKLGSEYLQHVVNGLFLEVGFLYEHVARSVEHSLGGVETNALDRVDDPLVDLVRELVEIDVLVYLALVELAEYVDSIFGKHAGKLDVHTAAADGQRHFFGTEINLCFLVLLVNVDARNLCRTERTLDEELDVCGVVNNVDVLVAQLAYDAVNAAYP